MAELSIVKQGKNFIVYSDGNQKLIKVINVRLSYPHFGAQREETDEETGSTRKSWNGVAMLSKSTHVAAKDAFVEIMNGIMAEQVNDKGKKGIVIPPEYRCIKNGDDKEDENMHGHWLISFSDSNRRPGVRDRQGRLIVNDRDIVDEAAIDRMFYGGCYGSVLLRPWYFNGKAKGKTKTYPKRICCGFIGAQFVDDGEPFGSGRIDDSNVWDAVEGGADDDGLSTKSSASSFDDEDGL